MTKHPNEPDTHALTVERAVKPDGSTTYTIELSSAPAAVLAAAAALANMDPSDWLIRVIGKGIADEAGPP